MLANRFRSIINKFENCTGRTTVLRISTFVEIFFMPHFVYILQSQKDQKYYIGETANVAARLLFHNSGRQRSTSKIIDEGI